MLTFAIAVAHRGHRLDDRVRDVLAARRPVEVPFDPADRLLWADPTGTVRLGAWRSDAGATGRHWYEHPGGVVAFNGDPWPRGRRWRAGQTWGAQLADHLRTHPLRAGVDDLLGVFTCLELDSSGRGAVASDLFGMGHLYWGSDADATVVSTRASLTARLLAVGGAPPPVRDPFGAAWVAFADVPLGNATGFAGVEVVPPAVRLEISPDQGARLVAGRARYWKLPAPATEALPDLIRAVRDDIATTLHRVLHEPVPNRIAGLTGGRDSRTVLAVMVEEGLADEFRFETYGSPDMPDVIVAETIAARLGLRHHRGTSGTGTAYRVARARALRDGGYGDLSDRELSLRLAVGVGDGMLNLMHAGRGHPAQGDQVLVSGYLGEGLRTDFPGAGSTATRTEAWQFPYVELGYGRAGILRPAAHERYRQDLHALMVEGVEPQDSPKDVVDAWFLRNRFRRHMGPEQELNSANAVFPLYSVLGIRTADALGAEDRWADRLPYEIIRHAAPALAALPFEDGTWDERLRDAPIGRGPPLPPPARGRRLRRAVGSRWPARLRHRTGPSTPRSYGSEQRSAFAPVDAEIMRRYFSDGSNPVFEVLDQRAVLERVGHFTDLPESLRRQLYGALTAALWLGGHEITYPLPGSG
jgi:hypothetical protein